MNITALQPKVVASDIPPEQLAGNTSLTKEQKIAEASRQFEAVLLRQILEQTQKTVIHSKYTDDSMASAIYRDQITSQLADSISKSGEFGLAKTFDRQLTRPSDISADSANSKTDAGGSNCERPIHHSGELRTHDAVHAAPRRHPILHFPRS